MYRIFLLALGIAIWGVSALKPAVAAEPTAGRVLVIQAALSALQTLPTSANAQPLAAFFQHYRPYLEAHSDTTNSGERMDVEAKSKNFIDLDTLGTAPSFAEIPHRQDEAIAKFGLQKLRGAGTAPWALGQEYQQLVYAFQNKDLPAILSHSERINNYTYDLHQPFHVTKNYNGQETGQYGIHNRFEGLPERVKMTIADLKPGTPTMIGDTTELGFTWATQAWNLAAVILDADKASRSALPGAKTDDPFSAKALPITRTVLSQTSTDLASLYYSAWVMAGQPALSSEINPTRLPVKAVH